MPWRNLYRAGHYAAYCHLLAPGSQLQVGWALTREPKWKQRTLDLTGRPGYHYLGRLALIAFFKIWIPLHQDALFLLVSFSCTKSAQEPNRKGFLSCEQQGTWGKLWAFTEWKGEKLRYNQGIIFCPPNFACTSSPAPRREARSHLVTD